jgi:hypothetical protein
MTDKWKYTGSAEDFADFKFEAIGNFLDAHFAEMELYEQEEKDPEQVTAAMLDAANEATTEALDGLIEAEFAFRAALRREDEPKLIKRRVLHLVDCKPQGNA